MAILYRAGDIVMAKCQVKYDCIEGDTVVHMDVLTRDPAETRLVSRRFRPGETAYLLDPSAYEVENPGKVLSVYNDMVWVEFMGAPLSLSSLEVTPFNPDAEDPADTVDEPPAEQAARKVASK